MIWKVMGSYGKILCREVIWLKLNFKKIIRKGNSIVSDVFYK